MAGSAEDAFSPTETDQYNIETYYTPTLFSPAPPLFQVPAECPLPVREELSRAWTLFWVDHAACANRIRTCVEMALSDEGVKRFRSDRRGRRTRLTLHERILLYKDRDSQLAGAMMAVKWLGNVGSHGQGEVSRDRLFDGFDLLEHVLQEVYARHSKRLARLQRDLVRSKGRAPKRRTSTIE